MRRANSIPATRQAEIEAAYGAIDAAEIGEFNAAWLRETTQLYLRTGRGFAGQKQTDDDFLRMFEQNLADMRAASGRLRELERADG
jgi:hypothetical protein